MREVWSQPDPVRLAQLVENVRDGRFKIPIALRLDLSEIRKSSRSRGKGCGREDRTSPVSEMEAEGRDAHEEDQQDCDSGGE